MICRYNSLKLFSFLLSITITATTPTVGAQESVATTSSTIQQPTESPSTPSPSIKPPPPTKSPLTLRGQISNQDRLAPVEPQYRTGASLDVANVGKLKALSPNNHWDRIPDWFAGTWLKKTSTVFYRYTYGLKTKNFSVETDMAISGETRGWQKDRAGNIWEYSYQNYYTVTECEDYWAVGYVKDAEMLEVTPEKTVMRFVAIKTIVDKTDKTILQTLQTESIQTYTPYADGIVKIVSSIKAFDEDGNPLRLSKALSLEQRTKAYSPMNQYRGHDMRKLFAEYLTTQGMASLVPIAQPDNSRVKQK